MYYIIFDNKKYFNIFLILKIFIEKNFFSLFFFFFIKANIYVYNMEEKKGKELIEIPGYDPKYNRHFTIPVIYHDDNFIIVNKP